MNRFIQNLLLLGLMTLLIVGCEQKPTIAPSGKTIRIGIIAPLSGSGLAKGKDGLKGIETAMKIKPLLENGDRIELVLKDDRDEPFRSVNAIQELAEAEDVSAIVTFSSSDAVLAMARVADTYKTPILAVLATHPEVTAGNEFVSQLCFDDQFQGTVAALFVRDELLIDKVAVFSNPDSIYSRNLANVFKQKFISIDGQVTDSVSMNENTKNLNNILEVLKTNGPELLYLPIKAKNVIHIIKELRKIKWTPIVMGSDGLLANMISQSSEEVGLLDGILATDFFHYDMHLTPYGKKVAAVFKERVTTYSALGVESYALLISAMNRCRDPRDKQCLNQSIRSSTDFTGVTGKITITSNGKAARPVVVNTIKGGHLEFVVKVH